jgi:hypothetical protein
VFVPGITSTDEPLAIELTPGFFKELNPAPVVADWRIVGGEDLGDAMLTLDMG